MQKLAGILTEGYTDAKRADNAHDLGKSGEENLYGAGVERGEEIEKKKMTKAEAKKMIKDAILAEMSHDDDPRDPHADPYQGAGGDYLMREEGEEITEGYVAFAMQNIGDESTPVTLTHGFDRYDEREYKTTLGKALTFIEKNADASAIENGDVTVDGGPGLVRITIGDQEFDIQSSAEEITEASTEAIDRMNGLVDRRVISSMLYSVGQIIKSLTEEGFEEDEIHDYLIYLVTTLDDSALMEAKKDEKEEEEVEIEDIETVEEPAADDNVDMDMEGDLDLDAGSDEAKDAFDELTDAYRAAKELGDEKLVRQLANTITYFNKNIILK